MCGVFTTAIYGGVQFVNKQPTNLLFDLPKNKRDNEQARVVR